MDSRYDEETDLIPVQDNYTTFLSGNTYLPVAIVDDPESGEEERETNVELFFYDSCNRCIYGGYTYGRYGRYILDEATKRITITFEDRDRLDGKLIFEYTEVDSDGNLLGLRIIQDDKFVFYTYEDPIGLKLKLCE
ncbi:MAG: hypothetical protein VZR56_10145 [Treponema sp.]|nr:hypothetical protein [Treponema sp.]